METSNNNRRIRIILAVLSIVTLLAIVVGIVAVGEMNKRKDLRSSKSKASVNTLATADACMLTINIPTPTPKKPTPTQSQTPKKCKVSFRLEDQAVCWYDKRVVPVIAYIESLPDGGPFYLETDWYIASPVANPIIHHYEVLSTPLQVGQTYTIYADWPGIAAYNPRPDTVEIHTGINVRTIESIVSPNCTGGIDHYWTPYVSCPDLPPQ